MTVSKLDSCKQGKGYRVALSIQELLFPGLHLLPSIPFFVLPVTSRHSRLATSSVLLIAFAWHSMVQTATRVVLSRFARPFSLPGTVKWLES